MFFFSTIFICVCVCVQNKIKGNPHVLPSVIVAKIMERFQLTDEKGRIYDVFNDGRPMSAPPTPGPTDLTDLDDLRHPEP